MFSMSVDKSFATLSGLYNNFSAFVFLSFYVNLIKRYAKGNSNSASFAEIYKRSATGRRSILSTHFYCEFIWTSMQEAAILLASLRALALAAI